jgi:hypothetical protein
MELWCDGSRDTADKLCDFTPSHGVVSQAVFCRPSRAISPYLFGRSEMIMTTLINTGWLRLFVGDTIMSPHTVSLDPFIMMIDCYPSLALLCQATQPPLTSQAECDATVAKALYCADENYACNHEAEVVRWVSRHRASTISFSLEESHGCQGMGLSLSLTAELNSIRWEVVSLNNRGRIGDCAVLARL